MSDDSAEEVRNGLDLSQSSSSRPEEWAAKVEREVSGKTEAQLRRMLRNRALNVDGDLSELQQRYKEPRDGDLLYDDDVFVWRKFERPDEKNRLGGGCIWLLVNKDTNHVLAPKGGVPCRNIYGSNERDGLFFLDWNKMLAIDPSLMIHEAPLHVKTESTSSVGSGSSSAGTGAGAGGSLSNVGHGEGGVKRERDRDMESKQDDAKRLRIQSSTSTNSSNPKLSSLPPLERPRLPPGSCV